MRFCKGWENERLVPGLLRIRESLDLSSIRSHPLQKRKGWGTRRVAAGPCRKCGSVLKGRALILRGEVALLGAHQVARIERYQINGAEFSVELEVGRAVSQLILAA